MANRYLNLFKLPERLYAKGSPIIIEAGALHKDLVLNDIVAQLKFRSIVANKVSSVTVDITCYNASNKVITSSFVYKYEDIAVNENELFFGNKILVTLPNNDTRSFNVKITQVEFLDGTCVVIPENNWKSLPKQTAVSNYENIFINYFTKKYGSSADFLPTEYDDLWFCACGQENRNDKEICSRCGLAHSVLFPFDIEQEKKNAVYELAEEEIKSFHYEAAIKLFESISGWKDADGQLIACQKKIEEIKAKAEADRLEKERQAEIARKEAERIAKRNKKIAIITTPIVCAIIAFIIVLNTVIIPNNKYNDAIALMDAGNIVEAYEALVALDGYKDSADKANSIYHKCKVEKLKVAKVGDYVFFGAYEQDNNTSNGKEDVEWLVLEVKDEKALVISKYALDCKQYNTSYTDVTWETCTLRKWLNNDFINAAFSADEKAMIPTVTVSADKNPDYITNPGNATQDKVFLLSITEANKHFSSDSARQCKPTEYAVAGGAYVISYYVNYGWWLRSPGYIQNNAAYVFIDGDVSEHGLDVLNDDGAVRPALWIDFSKID